MPKSEESTDDAEEGDEATSNPPLAATSVAKPSGMPVEGTEEEGWMDQLIKRILANITFTAENLILKFDCEHIVLSATLRSCRLFSADPQRDWQAAWMEPFGP